MLAEALRSLLTPCPRHLRRLGCLKESIGLEARWRRCRRAWEPHLQACRGAILEAATGCAAHRRVAILGSGGLHDVPLAQLAAQFDEVLLVDVLHLPEAKRQMRRFDNVRPVALDVTGTLIALDRQRRGRPLPLLATDILSDLQADLVVSLNLLFQLPILPKARLEALGRDAAEIDAFCQSLVKAHLDALAAEPGQACLITEVEHLLIGRDGSVVERDDPLENVSLPFKPLREWTWDIAPRPEAHREYDLRYRVQSFDVKTASRVL